MPPSSESVTYWKYLQSRSRLGKWYRQWILYPRLSKCLKGRVLDFGCGIGDFLHFYPRAVGVDINHNCVEFCQANGLKTKHSKLDRIPYPRNSFDSILMDNVLEHIAEGEVDRVLSEIRRVLCQGGLLLVGVPGEQGFAYDPDHKVFYDKQSLQSLMGKYQFECQKIFQRPAPFSFFSHILRQQCLYGLFKDVTG